ncbi:MAG: transporter substrate-binding domain-containing protein [Desulfococcaceae bacterium]|jgi:polar amino acid transport system substrate-binding protein|nr:transporter substrate-binding domain-containing protein [Desulfococcaceae bacterium]
MKGLWGIIVFTGMLLLSSVSGGAEQKIRIMTEDIPPFNFKKDGTVQGVSTDLLLLMLEKAGIPADRSAIKVLPWARSYRMLQEEPGTMLYSMAKTADREKLFKWVGPIQEVTTGLVALKSRKIVIGRLEDARKYRIGTIRDNASEQLLIKSGFDENSLDRIASPELNIKKLQAGRVDMLAFNVPTTHYLMLQIGLSPQDYEVVYPLKKVFFNFAFHKDTDDKLIEKLNGILAELKKPDTSGESPYSRIVKKYLGTGFEE